MVTCWRGAIRIVSGSLPVLLAGAVASILCACGPVAEQVPPDATADQDGQVQPEVDVGPEARPDDGELSAAEVIPELGPEPLVEIVEENVPEVIEETLEVPEIVDITTDETAAVPDVPEPDVPEPTCNDETKN
ncbi:MAG: hypothetical protein FJ109_09485, partial [Deltaproteobacteria bacterium]|nr:hypothetical protein [Deltaproteobacteria bacterium]